MNADDGTVPVVPVQEFAEPGALAAEVIDRWVRAAYAIATSDPINEEPAEVVAQAFTELLTALGYVGGCSVTPSPFGGYTIRVGARRAYPSELSDPAGTVKE